MTAAMVPLVAAAAPATPLHSAVYVGRVRHRRSGRTRHAFGVRLYLLYLDLDELDLAFGGRWLWSAQRPAPMRFRRGDYFGDPARPLADEVRDAVAAATGARPDGAVRVLTSLRCLGYAFNPVSFYYCFDRHGALAAVLAEITNTPWGERHHYVVGRGGAGSAAGTGEPLRAAFDKRFHVSPFQPMEQQYRWTLATPGERLTVHMENVERGELVFDATLELERRPWSTASLLRALARHPWMTAKVIAMIWLQALLLWCKRARFHAHPRTRCPGRS
jgi:DUF1365 family protein